MNMFKLGDGVTICYYTDRTAATIVRVSKSGRTAWVQEDKAIRIDNNGMSDSQEYRYEPNPEGTIMRVYLDRKGRAYVYKQGLRVALGGRRAYHDYSF